jgi:hypothetical protein
VDSEYLVPENILEGVESESFTNVEFEDLTE